MKANFVVMALVLAFSCAFSCAAFADTSILKGKDDQGKTCSLVLVDSGVVRTSYSGSVLFELAPAGGGDFRATRILTTASTQISYDLLFDGNRNSYRLSEMRMNLRTGDVFFEQYRECQLF